MLNSDYERFIEELEFAGVSYILSFNNGHTIVRFDEYENGYAEAVYDEMGNCIYCVDVFEGTTYIKPPTISEEKIYKQTYVNYFAELQEMGNLL